MVRGVDIMGIDPGTRVVGYGVVRTEGSRLALLAAGTISPRRGDPLPARLAHISGEVTRLVARHRPAAAAVEDVFVKTDPRAALSIGHGRGVVLAVLGGHGVPVHDYPPASVKRSVAGNGRAGKEQVARMVGMLLGADVAAIPLDATDALAVAIAHALAARTQAIVGEEVKRPQAR